MRFHIVFFLIALAFALPRPSRAQQPAPTAISYLITNTGEKLLGQLEVSQYVSEFGVKLKIPNQGSRRYLPSECREFVTADGRRFFSRRVSFAAGQSLVARPTSLYTKEDSATVFLQALVLGKARLYQLYYHVQAEAGPLEYLKYETRFFYMQVPGSALLMVQQSTYQSALTTAFRDCPAILGDVQRTIFDAQNMSRLVMGYNNACAAGFSAATLLPIEGAGLYKTMNIFGVRVGTGIGSLRYANSLYANQQTDGQQLNWSIGGSLELLSGTSRWGGSTGFYFTARRQNGVVSTMVPVGFNNAGAALQLRQQLAINSVQVPLLVQYALASPQARLQPFAAVGPVLGCDFAASSFQDITVSVVEPGRFTPVQAVQNIDINAEAKGRIYPVLGGQATLGLRLKTGAHAYVAELFYENGRQLVGHYLNGNLSYQNTGLRVGLNF